MTRRGQTAAVLVLILLLTTPVQAAGADRGAVTLSVPPDGHSLILVPGAPDGVDPVLCDGQVVWYAPGHQDWDILAYDPEEGTLTAQRTGGVLVQGDRIAWIETDRTGNAWLTGPERDRTPLLANDWEEGHAVIGGEWLVYERVQDDESDIFLYNLTDSTETAVCTAPGDQRRPWVSGTIVVWENWQDGTADISLVDLATGEGQVLAAGQADQSRPVISGNRIVWQERRDGIWKVRLADLRGAPLPLPEEGRGVKEPSPSLSGDLLLWTKEERGGVDLCLLQLDLARAGERHVDEYVVENKDGEEVDADQDYRGEIAGGEYAFFATGVPAGTARASVDLNWNDDRSSLLLLITGPDGSVFRFRDEDDREEDRAVRLSFSREGRVAPGTWTSAVYGEEIRESVNFTYRWYLEPI